MSMGTGKSSQCVAFRNAEGKASAGCFEVMCNEHKTEYIVLFNLKEQEFITCMANTVNQLFSSGEFQVQCKDPRVVCRDRNTACSFDCYLRGRCQENKKCVCNYFYEGDYCQFERKAPPGLEKYWEDLKRFNGILE